MGRGDALPSVCNGGGNRLRGGGQLSDWNSGRYPGSKKDGGLPEAGTEGKGKAFQKPSPEKEPRQEI